MRESNLTIDDNLPEKWISKPIGAVCEFEKGKKPKNTGKQSSARSVPYINIKAFESGMPKEFAEPGPYPMCSKDDVLIVWDGARSGLVGRGVAGYIGSTLSKIWSPSTKNKYLFYFLRLHYDYINTNTKGVGIPHVDPTILNAINLPIAPQNEQKRIVDEIEKQFSRLDEAVAALKRIKANLKRYKASVLKAAVEGKLTEEWRKEHLPAPSSKPGMFYTYAILCDDNSIYIGHTDNITRRWKEHREGQGAEWTKKHKPLKIAHYEEYKTRKEASDREKWLKTGFGRKWIKRELEAGRTRQAGDVEPASELLKRILVERRMKWEEAYPKKKYKVPASPEIEELPPIPNSWAWVTLPQLGELNRGKSKHRPRNDPKLYDGPYPFIQTGDIRHATDVIAEYSQTYSEEGLKQSRLWPKGTLCITIAANIADTAILGFDACFPDSIVGFIPDTKYTDVRFVEYFLRTAKENIERFAPATAQKNINLAILGDVAIPMPPFNEQRAIATEIEERLSVAEKNESVVDLNIRRAERFCQSILKMAFSGRLLKQDPNDEPASVLLERIKEQRKLKQKKKRKLKRKPSIVEADIMAKEKIINILNKSKESLTPEELFRKCGFDKNEVEEFYAELKQVDNEYGIVQKKDSSGNVKIAVGK